MHDPDGFVLALSAMSENTRRAYEHDAREFVQWCERGGCPDPSALDHRTLRRYLAYLQTRGFSRSSTARKAASVRAYLRHLRRRGVFGRDVASAVQAPKGARRLPRMPRKNEAAALLDELSDGADTADPRALRDLAVVELLYGAGLRVSECCGLDVGDVDLRRSLVTVLGKGAKVRRLPLGEPACDAVAMYLRVGPLGCYNPVRRPVRRCSSTPGAGADAPRRAAGARPPSAGRRPVAAPPRAAPRVRHPPARRRSRSHEQFRSCSDTPMWERHRSTLT